MPTFSVVPYGMCFATIRSLNTYTIALLNSVCCAAANDVRCVIINVNACSLYENRILWNLMIWVNLNALWLSMFNNNFTTDSRLNNTGIRRQLGDDNSFIRWHDEPRLAKWTYPAHITRRLRDRNLRWSGLNCCWLNLVSYACWKLKPSWRRCPCPSCLLQYLRHSLGLTWLRPHKHLCRGTRSLWNQHRTPNLTSLLPHTAMKTTQWTIKKRDILFLTITSANLNQFL